MAEVCPLIVTRAACGEHEPVRDVSRSRRRGFSGRTGGFCPHERSLAGCVPGAGDGWTPSKMCFKIPIRQDKRQDAVDLLAPVYGWFTEGFDTADLREAKALLDELA
ncbi:MAG: hypothetical protein ACYSVY_28810, partial [Planctomycetota bacterium]